MSKRRPAASSVQRGKLRKAASRGGLRRARGVRLRLDPLGLALVVLALAIRLWGVGDRLPDPTLGINVLDDSAVEETDRTTMGRAWQMWGGGTKPLDLNPHTGGWPGLSFYFGLGIQMAYKAAYAATHGGTSPEGFSKHIREGSNHMFLFGRIASVLIGAWTIFLAYRLGERLAGPAAGLLGALLLALNPIHIMTSQHIADPNLLALLFVLLAALAMTRIVERGAVRDSVIAGAMIGLAAACKYVPLVLVLPLALAHGRRFYREGAFFLALLATAGAMFAASPFTFLDWKTTLQDIATQRRALFSDWVGQTAFPFSLPTYLAVSLPHAMGWPAYLLSLAGMVLLWRRGGASRVVALIPIVLVLANGALRAAQERYMLAALPVLFLGSALAMLRGAAWLRDRGTLPRRLAPAAPVLAFALALAWPLPEFVKLRRVQSLPDTRHLARRWINANIGAERPMAVELYGPVFQPDERAIVIWPFFATQVPLVRPAYHREFLDGLDYYVLSGEISRRFDAAASAYPVESAYYRWIREHAPVVWRSDPKGSQGPAIEIRRVPASVSTEAERESVFASAMPRPSHVSRLALWCLDFANLFGRLSHPERAEEWAMRGLRVETPRMNARLYATLAYARIHLGKFAEAESVATEGILVAPRDPTLRLYHATALHELGYKEEALKQYRTAYDISGDPRILLNMAASLRDLKRYEEALRELDRVPREHPDRGVARRDMAILFLNHLNRPLEGLAALQEAASLARDPEQVKLLRDEVVRLQGLIRTAPSGSPEQPVPR